MGLKKINCFIIRYTFEWLSNVFLKKIYVTFKNFKSLWCTINSTLDKSFDICFLQVKRLIMWQEWILSIHHPKLSQVTTCFWLFSTENRTKVEDTTKSHSTSLKIKLTRLAQESRCTKVVCLKQFCWIFSSITRQDRTIKFDEAIFIKEIISCIDNGITNLLDSHLLTWTQPEVTIIHQKVSTMFFWSNWVALRLTDNFDISNIQFITKFWTFIFFDHPSYVDRCFLAKVFDSIKFFKTFFFTKFFDKVWFESNPLEKGCSITQLQESNFTFSWFVSNPSPDSDFFTDVFRYINNWN